MLIQVHSVENQESDAWYGEWNNTGLCRRKTVVHHWVLIMAVCLKSALSGTVWLIMLSFSHLFFICNCVKLMSN